jgi:UDP-GlcNAc:undecaprenyl-phosphate/decaprenyl-phosphate GlcNAc-1-phosphate transferase
MGFIGSYFWLFIIPLAIAFFATPLVLKYAVRKGAVDVPNERKLHEGSKPILGGISLYVAIVVATLIFYELGAKVIALLGSLTIIVIIGVIDDLYDLRPYQKLLGQFAAAVILVNYSVTSYRPILEFLDDILAYRIISFIVVIVWIVAITNAFNLIDGLDGLATGTAVIIGGFLIILSIVYVNYLTLGISIILVGSCLGFLPFNFQPAKIFLGDTGSMLLGFTLAAVFLFNVDFTVSRTMLFGVVFLFIYPTIDLVYAVIRRIRSGTHIFKADSNHIHHQILRKGIPVRYVVYILCLGSFLIGVAGMLILTMPQWVVLIKRLAQL